MRHFEIYNWYGYGEQFSTRSMPIMDLKMSQDDGKAQLIEYCHVGEFSLLGLYDGFKLLRDCLSVWWRNGVHIGIYNVNFGH